MPMQEVKWLAAAVLPVSTSTVRAYADSTFAGSLTSTVTCSSCHESSVTVDPILDIQLDFPTSPESETVTLAGLLRRFCAEEKVVGDPGKGYACSKCGGGPGVVGFDKG